MKRYVAHCPATDVALIVVAPDSVVLPPEGGTVAIACPCCGQTHAVKIRAAKPFRRAS